MFMSIGIPPDSIGGGGLSGIGGGATGGGRSTESGVN